MLEFHIICISQYETSAPLLSYIANRPPGGNLINSIRMIK